MSAATDRFALIDEAEARLRRIQARLTLIVAADVSEDATGHGVVLDDVVTAIQTLTEEALEDLVWLREVPRKLAEEPRWSAVQAAERAYGHAGPLTPAPKPEADEDGPAQP